VHRRLLSLVLIVSLLLLTALPASAQAPEAVNWLLTQQRDDGGFGAEASTLSETAEVVYALAAAGEDVAAVTAADGASPLDFLAANLDQATTVGSQAKVALAFTAAGQDASDIDGTNLIAAIAETLDADGKFGGPDATLVDHAYAMLALASADQEVPSQSVGWLLAQQAPNGGFAWNASTAEADVDSNSTSLAVQALVAAGVAPDDPAIASALEYLRGLQNEDGGFPYQKPSPFGTDTDANSTAVVMQALAATGQDLADWVTEDGNGPDDALLALQDDDGALAWQAAFPAPNLLATAQAIPALLGRPYPIAVTPAAAQAEVTGQQAATAEPTEAATAEPTATAVPATPAPVIPTTGGVVSSAPWGQVLMGAGALIAGAGYLLRRRLGRS
jgi:prenyltransferase beta subunit